MDWMSLSGLEEPSALLPYGASPRYSWMTVCACEAFASCLFFSALDMATVSSRELMISVSWGVASCDRASIEPPARAFDRDAEDVSLPLFVAVCPPLTEELELLPPSALDRTLAAFVARPAASPDTFTLCALSVVSFPAFTSAVISASVMR